MTHWKEFRRRAGKSANRMRPAAGAMIQGLEQRTLLAGTPVLDWSTYLGGGGADDAEAIAVDASGDAWIAGGTNSPDFADGEWDTDYNGDGHAFVRKIHPDGTLVWSTFLGPGIGRGIAIDADGNAWVTGWSDSPDFAKGGFDTSNHGGCDAFVAKVNADGTLAWSSYLGGMYGDFGHAIAIDGNGNAWVTGTTYSRDFAVGGFDTTYNTFGTLGNPDAFVAKINADGTFGWSSYLGGGYSDEGNAIAIDANGNAWVAGGTGSADWTVGGFDTHFTGSLGAFGSGFAAKINADGTLGWSTYLGNGWNELGTAIAIDGSGNAWLTGFTNSSDWASGGFDTSYNGAVDATVMKINADGTLAWSSYLGGDAEDRGSDIAIDVSGNVWVTGITWSSGWTSGGFDTSFNGDGRDAFVVKINANGTVEWSSYLGTDVHDDISDHGTDGPAIVPDSNGNVWVTGATYAPGWTSGGSDTCFNGGGSDAFVAKISEHAHAPVVADQALTTDEGTAIRGAVTGADPNGDALSYRTVIRPSHGALSFLADGTFLYTPSSNYYGPDSFTYQANDGTWDSNTATVSLTVMPQRQWPPEDLDTLGREFWLAFGVHVSGSSLDEAKYVYLSARQEAHVTVAIPGMGWTQDYLVTPGDVTTVQVPWDAYANSVDGISNVGIHVTSDQEIAVYGLSQGPRSTDGFTALPVDVLGNSYIAVACEGSSAAGPGTQLEVVGTEDQTTVTITPSVKVGTHLAGVPFDVTLAKGQVYQLKDADLTGTRIESDRPVAVFSGNQGGPYVVEQLLPVMNWGTRYITVPMAPASAGDTFRVLASEDGTDVSVNGVFIPSLSAGQYYQWQGSTAQEIISNKPVALAQYANSYQFSRWDPADATMTILPPADAAFTDYMVITPAHGFGSHFINFWTAAGTTVLLDGEAIPYSDFTPIGNSHYVAASIRVDVGTHIVHGSAPVGVMLYGFSYPDLYAYVGGQKLPVAFDQNITVLPDTLYTGTVSSNGVHGYRLTYDVSDQPQHGTLVFQTDGSFTYMPAAGYSGMDQFHFWATDGSATSNLATVSITVLPPNHPPAIANQTFYVDEHSATYAPVDVVQADDPDAGDVLGFAILDGDPNGVFAIDPATGLIQVMKPEYLDFETMPRRYDLTVQVTDTGIPALSSQATVTINVLDIDESSTGFDLSGTSIPEHRPAGMVVGDLLASNPDRQSSMAYTLVSGPGSNDNATFSIVDQKLVANLAFDYEVRTSYRIRIRGTDGMTVFIEKPFTINVTNINEAPAAIELSSLSVPEDQVPGTLVGLLSASSGIADDTFTFSLVEGEGSGDNRYFRVEGNRLLTAEAFSYSSDLNYGIRIGVTNSCSLSVARSFVIAVTPRQEFGKVEKTTRSLTIRDQDGDAVTFKLSGGGLGAVNGTEVSLIGTTAKSVLSISVKRSKTGDGLYTLTGLASDGLLKGISGSAVVLSGSVQINCLNQAPGRAAISMKLAQVNDAEICIQGLSMSSLTVGGDVSHSRITTSGSINKFSAAALLDSEILVGVASDFTSPCAGAAGDFTAPTAKLGSLTITGRKLSKGQLAPAYVANSHISAPTVGTIVLMNVPADSQPVVHVLNDVGILKVNQSKATSTAMLESGTWKTSGIRPPIWEVL